MKSITAFFQHKKTVIIIKLIIPSAILVYLINRVDVSLTKSLIVQTNLSIFVLSFVLLCIRNIVGAYRNSILLKFKKMDFSVAALTRYYFIGNFFNLFLPELVGRDIARGYYLYNSSSGKKEAISSIVVERFIGTAALMLLSLFSVLLAVSMDVNVISNDIVKVIIIIFTAGCLMMILFFYEKTDRFFERLMPESARTKIHSAITFIRDIISYGKSPVIIIYTLLISIVFQFIGVIAVFLLALSLESTVYFIYFLIFLPVIWIAGMLPVSPNGLGVREGTFVFLFSSAGMSKEMAVAICLLLIFQNLCLGLIGGILFVIEKKKDENNPVNPV